jgi:predicted nucleic acid-binding protein
LRRKATSLPERNSSYLIDNTVFIAAVKKGWTKSTELILHLLDNSAELLADELLIFEYEKYAKILGTYELLYHLKRSVIQVNPSQEEIDICAPFFPESELSDIVHAATCLYTKAILITNDNHFDKIKEAKIVEVWSAAKAIKRILNGEADYEDPIP